MRGWDSKLTMKLWPALLLGLVASADARVSPRDHILQENYFLSEFFYQVFFIWGALLRVLNKGFYLGSYPGILFIIRDFYPGIFNGDFYLGYFTRYLYHEFLIGDFYPGFFTMGSSRVSLMGIVTRAFYPGFFTADFYLR